MLYTKNIGSPLGGVLLASDGTQLVGLWLDGQQHFAVWLGEEQVHKDDLPIFGRVEKWLDEYFAGKKPSLKELPLAPAGSDFRQSVYKILLEIPYGQTITYGEIAKKIADSSKRATSARAVGNAVGGNPISIIIPCHRVVGANNNLTGYAGGLERKIQLLKREGVPVEGFTMPGRRAK